MRRPYVRDPARFRHFPLVPRLCLGMHAGRLRLPHLVPAPSRTRRTLIRICPRLMEAGPCEGSRTPVGYHRPLALTTGCLFGEDNLFKVIVSTVFANLWSRFFSGRRLWPRDL